MLTWRWRCRRRVSPAFVLVILLLTVWYIVLPPDSAVVLAVNFNAWRVRAALGAGDGDAWLRGQGMYPVHMPSEVGCLIKTGYGTRRRVKEQLEAFAAKGGVLGDEGRDFLVVGDWTGGGKEEDLGPAEIHDAIRLVMESGVGREHAEHHRFGKYRSLQGAVDAGDDERAEELGMRFGWELDALKFIMGMELSYRRMPHKKWYMILDDDTFVVKESLQLLLSHLDPAKPQYVGNSVGDYRARFAHGGSAVLVSGQAMKILFGRPDMVTQAYVRSLDETWGDRLVATTLQRVGVYIDERHSHYFNGETPEMTRIRPDRACSPIVSFHGLRKPGAMAHVGRTLARRHKLVLWGELWELFGKHPAEEAYHKPPFRAGDHVGPGEEGTTTWRGVKSAESCQRKCRGQCLAWSFDTETNECRASPWVIPGSETVTSATVSGVNWSKAKSILRECPLAK
ncbi:hypothetical protein EsDP_00002857 [Epichloe bromicola]|uniref:N-acetylgalactosaminide beta-1,3-galactosyltransferase n=1 Tax=Epichloe bromicola TaxID=79588 RepID=A0ABQ0CM13_9HYPO